MWLRDAFAHPSSTVLPSMTSCHKVGHGCFFSLDWRQINPLFCFKTYLPKKKQTRPHTTSTVGDTLPWLLPQAPFWGSSHSLPHRCIQAAAVPVAAALQAGQATSIADPSRSSIGRTVNSIACPPPSRSFTLSGGTGLVKSDSEPVKLCPLANRVCACPTAYSHLHDTLRWKEPL